MTLLENLLLWHERGWTALPCVAFWTIDKNGKRGRHKQPIIDWTTFETRRPTLEEIQQWGRAYERYAGVCVVTGAGIVGVDFDQKDGKPNVEHWAHDLLESGATWTTTASGGIHYYFRTKEPLKNATNIFGADKASGETLVDIRGEGGIIVVGETPLWDKDPRGGSAKIVGRYHTENILSVQELPEIPDVFKFRARDLPSKWLSVADGVVKEGSRHDTAKSLIAKMLYMVRTPDDIPIMREAFRRLMQSKFDSMLSEDEVSRIFDWAIDKERKKRGESWYLFSSVLKDAVKKTKEEREAAEDLNEWGIEITKVERNDDRITFTFADGKSCVVQTDDIFNQTKFRSAFVRGTNVVLPEIRRKSYLAFIQSIPIIEVEDVGGSFLDAINETLQAKMERLAPAEDEAEAMDTAFHRGFGKYGKTIFFKLPALMVELKKSYPSVKRATLTDTLRGSFTYLRITKGRLWTKNYDETAELGTDRSPQTI